MDANLKAPKFRRRAAERPDEVLDAALELFAAQGYARTTVEAVARRAGLSKAAVYLYFPSKQTLLQGLVRRAVGSIAEEVVAQMAHHRGDPRPVLGQVLRRIGQSLSDPAVAAVPAVVLREAPHAPEIAAMYRDEVLARVVPALTGLIAQGVAGGHIRAVDPELTVRSVIGPVLIHLLMAAVFGLVPKGEPGLGPGGGLALDRLIENHLMILNAGLAPDDAPGKDVE